MSRAQRGSLRKISNSEKCTANIEYKSQTMPWIPSDRGRGGVEITNIIAEDGRNIESGDYEFTVIDDDGLFIVGTCIRLKKEDWGWHQIT
jgi:hypothetical protein